jgi:hypothetical protein
MLLRNELQAEEIYIEDRNFTIEKDYIPSLYKLIEMPEKKTVPNLFSFGYYEQEIHPTWENIFTGELVKWDINNFTTFERIKKQYSNIELITEENRIEYLKRAIEIIEHYEGKFMKK